MTQTKQTKDSLALTLNVQCTVWSSFGDYISQGVPFVCDMLCNLYSKAIQLQVVLLLKN